MTIANWPIEDRPREKLLRQGESQLTDAELLAILLKTGVKGKTALDIAKDLLSIHGSLKVLFDLEKGTLAKIHGVGDAKLSLIKACRELGRRCQHAPITPGTRLNSSQLTQHFVANRLREHKSEVFACLFMDSQYRLIKFEELFYGTINEASVYPREIVRRSLALNAANVILAHNHPSGQSTPSPADLEVTNRIQSALLLIDVRVVDHIVVGNPDTFSFAESGYLANKTLPLAPSSQIIPIIHSGTD